MSKIIDARYIEDYAKTLELFMSESSMIIFEIVSISV